MTKSISVPQIFLSYAREDRETVENLYQRLSALGFKPWIDTKDILPGEIWMDSINHAIQQSDFFLAFLSTNSVSKRGVLQKEFKLALDVWQGMLEDDIYFIPIRLEDCTVPKSMSNFQWVDLFEEDGFSRLEAALRIGSERLENPLVQEELIKARPEVDKPFPDFIPKGLPGSTKRSTLRFWGIILGLFFMFAGLPWVYNNFIYDVKRPVMPETCHVSSEQVRVGLSRLPNCSSSFEDHLATSWVGDMVETSIIPQSFVSSDQARQQANYDIVVWGACENSTDETADLTIELITSRKPYGVYEPASLQVSGSLAELSEVGLALINYRHGEYSEATRLFDSLPMSVNSPVLALFRSNSLLFSERYADAISSFEKVARAGDISSAAAYNNMGIIYFNLNDDMALDQYTQAIELANENKENEVEGLAMVNRSQFYRLKSDWTNAYSDCIDSLRVNGQSALPNLCLSSYYFMYYRYSSVIGPLPLTEIDRKLNEAEKYEDVPPIIHFIRGDWYESHFWKRKQEAVNSYSSFLTEMEYRACLQKDHELIAFAVDAIKELTHP